MADQLRVSTYMPVLKSVKQADGSLRIVGILSDETMDLEDEQIPADLFQKSYPYLQQWGKVNWDHGDETIGEITDVRAVDARQAAQEFGVQLNGTGTRIETRIYPITDPALAPPELKRAHYLADAGAKLGFSADGVAIRKPGGGFSKMLARGAALTDQPVNPTCVARVVKSLSAALESGIEPREGNGPDVIVVQPDLPRIQAAGNVAPNPVVYALAKALATGTAVDPAAMTGGAALRQESLEGSVRDRMGRNGGPHKAGPGGACVCPSCGLRMEHTTGDPCTLRKCTDCGATLTRDDPSTEPTQKSLRRQSRPDITHRFERLTRKALRTLTRPQGGEVIE
jgi:hypothetical protein